jgi:hypothetical protein
MSALTRRRDPDVREECWQVYSGDVRIGTIAISTGNPDDTAPWERRCGFDPSLASRGMHDRDGGDV